MGKLLATVAALWLLVAWAAAYAPTPDTPPVTESAAAAPASPCPASAASTTGSG